MLRRTVTICLTTYLFISIIHSDFLQFSSKISHNKGYKVIPERAQMNYVNKSLADIKLKVFVYNRTVKPLNMSFHFYTHLSEEAMLFVNVYQFKSNQYKLTAIQFPIKIHEMLQMQWFGLDLFAAAAVPPIRWPIQVNVTYRITNWYPNSDLFTFSYNAVGKWKGNAIWYMDNAKKIVICDYDYFIAIEEYF